MTSFPSHQAVQQEVASKQPEFDSLSVGVPHLNAAQARMETTATTLNDRYAALKNQAKVHGQTFILQLNTKKPFLYLKP